jgi:acetolactate synthase regulatory subunit
MNDFAAALNGFKISSAGIINWTIIQDPDNPVEILENWLNGFCDILHVSRP